MNTSAPGIQHPYRRQVKDIGNSENTPHPFRWIVPSYNYILSDITPTLKDGDQNKLCLVENTGLIYRLVQTYPPMWDFVFKLDVNTIPSLVKALDDIQALYETKTNQSEFDLMVNAIHQINAALTTYITNDRIVNHLGANEPGLVLSANQGRILKGMIDDINVVLGVEGNTLVSLHEIVQYIELNREMLETLSVDSITGLNDALNARVRHIDLTPIHQSISQLADELLPKEYVIDSLEVRNPNFALSAKQGAEIADRLRTLETMLDSDDESLDTLQELVEYIKLNRATLDALNIDSILGLRDEIVKISQNAINLELHDTRLNFLENTVDVLSSAIDTLQSDKIEQGLEIASLEEDISELGVLVDTKVSGLTNNINNLTNLASTTASSFETLLERVSLLETSISDTTLGLSESISLLSSTTDTALSNIGTQLTTQGQSIDTVVSKQESYSTRLDGLDLSLSTLDLSVSGLQNNLSMLEESMGLSNNNLSDRINTTNENVLLNTTKLDTLTGALEQYVLDNDSALQSVSNRVVSLESNAQSLSTALNTTNSNVALLADRLSTSDITLNEHQTHLYTLDQKNIAQDAVTSQQQQQITQISQLTDSNINTINTLSSDVTVLSQDYNAWKSATDQRLDDIDTTLLSMGSSVSTLTDDLSAMYIELDARIDTAFSDIDNLNNDSRIVGAAQKSANLSDLTNTSTARQNLELGTAATRNIGEYSGQVPINDPWSLNGAIAGKQMGNEDTPGYCIITLPYSVNSHAMFSFTVKTYSSYVTQSYEISGYIYSLVNNWHSPVVLQTSSGVMEDRPLYFGIDENGYAYISIPVGNWAGVGIFNNVIGWRLELSFKGATFEFSTTPKTINSVSYKHNYTSSSANLKADTGQSTLYPMSQKAVTDALLVSSVVTSSNGTIDLRLGNSFRLTGLPMGTSHPISVIKPDLTDKVMSVTIMIDNQLDLEWPSDITWVETPILGPNYTMVVLAVYEDRTIGQVIVTA